MESVFTDYFEGKRYVWIVYKWCNIAPFIYSPHINFPDQIQKMWRKLQQTARTRSSTRKIGKFVNCIVLNTSFISASNFLYTFSSTLNKLLLKSAERRTFERYSISGRWTIFLQPDTGNDSKEQNWTRHGREVSIVIRHCIGLSLTAEPPPTHAGTGKQVHLSRFSHMTCAVWMDEPCHLTCLSGRVQVWILSMATPFLVVHSSLVRTGERFGWRAKTEIILYTKCEMTRKVMPRLTSAEFSILLIFVSQRDWAGGC